MKNYFLILFGLLSFSVISQEVTGVVYLDDNENGILDQGEKGLSKVAISNGKEVVTTDDKGNYVLPVGDDHIISVIKPAGYEFPVNQYNLPQFYYIHKPNGSPQMKFPGVSPTGKLPGKVNFGLIPKEVKEEFSILVFGDPQPYNEKEVDYFARGIVVELKGVEGFEFGISLGDLVGNDLDLFQPYIDAVRSIGVPWYNVMGNHDLNFDAQSDHLSDETFEGHFGPATYAFNEGKVHFIILDDILYPDPRDNKGYWGGFREDQLDFIENDLKHVPKDHLIVLAFHIPLTEPNADNFRDEDRERLFELLEEYPHTLSLSAHTHIQRQEFLGKEYGWDKDEPHHHFNVGTTSGDWYSGTLDKNGIPISTMRDGTPKGYAKLNFKGNSYSLDYKVAGKPEDYRMEIFAPKVVAQGRRTKAGIHVNFFIGSQYDKVMYRVDDGEWKPMSYLVDYDPSFVKDIFEWDLADELLQGRRSSNPIESTHLWRGSIPTNLAPGVHIIEVKAEDMFGKTFQQTRKYTLVPPK
ncbi:calcineurin-like phosphoesterase C-terminal domain-containing protein [Salegentibacter sp. F14]